MWKIAVLTCFTIPWINAQNGRNGRPFDNGYGWDIRLAVPGEPGNDYPTLNSIPRTSFTCSGKEPGYYADVETNCQVFRVCTLGSTYGFQSFLCPNGTLFNQAVFVCDWWMKVNCKKSKELFKINNNKYGTLKIGPQFMTDIKNMISHPMRNPYKDKYTTSHLIVMQDYKPPSNQLYSGALLSSSNKNPSNINIDTYNAQRNSFFNIYSTANTLSIPTTTSSPYFPNFNIYQTTNNKNVGITHAKQQTKSYGLPNRPENVKNSPSKHILKNVNYSGQLSQGKSLDVFNYDKNPQSVRPTQIYQRSVHNTQTTTSHERIKNNHGITNILDNGMLYNNHLSQNKEIDFGIKLSKQQLHPHVQYSKEIVGRIDNETKQNVVSSDTPAAIITKTLAFRSVVKDSKNGTPKSRITFKTWIIRPSRKSKLIVEPTPYTYSRPAKIIADISDNSNESVPNPPYVYNSPTVQLNDIATTSKETSSKVIESSTPTETIETEQVPPIAPTEPSLLYLVPTTFKPLSLLYVPPVVNEKQISGQYLPPITQNSDQVVAPSSPRPFFTTSKNEPAFYLNKQPEFKNNLAFSDILTKEKLDSTVNKIVKDTNSVLGTAASKGTQLFKQGDQSIDYPIDNYLYSDSDTQSDEKVTLQPPPPLPKSSRLIETPSIELKPPVEGFDNTYQNNNKISNLPYYVEPTHHPNTIERTVSLKITIPENIADLLFRTHNSSNFKELEILNTENSHNLVLTNKAGGNTDTNVVGKLIRNENSNISHSQDLVFSLLVDSINAAKDYNKIVQQKVKPTTKANKTNTQFQNIKNEDLQRISNDISQLTSSQFSDNSSNPRLPYQKTTLSPSDINTQNKYLQTGKQQTGSEQRDLIPIQRNTHKQIQSTNSPLSKTEDTNYFNINFDNLYSGQLYQLPVPVVTKQLYNSLYKFPNNGLQQNQIEFSANNNPRNDNYKLNSDVEIIQARTIDPKTFQHLSNPIGSQKDQGSSANDFINTLELPRNGFTAQLHDHIVGTIPHPLDEEKVIKYKNDQTYYIYSDLQNHDDLSKQITNTKTANSNLGNTVLLQNNKYSYPSNFQVIPALGYKLGDEKDKQNILNTFQIKEYGILKNIPSAKANLIRREDELISTDIDYTVEHPKSINIKKPDFLNSLYDGPNSYSAPQKSVGKLLAKQQISNTNLNIEKLDTDDEKNYGYPRISPVKRFLF